MELEKLLTDAGFIGSQDKDFPDTWVWVRGEEEVAVDHDSPETPAGEKVRWFAAGAGDPDELSYAQAKTRAMAAREAQSNGSWLTGPGGDR